MTRYYICPNCGSTRFKRVASLSAHFVYDRICRDCSSRYTPPTPKWMAIVGIITGAGIGTIVSVFAACLLWSFWNNGLQGIEKGNFAMMLQLPRMVWIIVGIGWTGVATGVRHFWFTRSDGQQ